MGSENALYVATGRHVIRYLSKPMQSAPPRMNPKSTMDFA